MRVLLLVLALLARPAYPTVTLSHEPRGPEANRLTLTVTGSGNLLLVVYRRDESFAGAHGADDAALCRWYHASAGDWVETGVLCDLDLDAHGGAVRIALDVPVAAPDVLVFLRHAAGPDQVMTYALTRPAAHRLALPLVAGEGQGKAASAAPKACIPGATNSGDYDLRRWIDDGSRYGRWEILPCDAPPPPPTPEPGPPLTPRAILFPIFGP